MLELVFHEILPNNKTRDYLSYLFNYDGTTSELCRTSKRQQPVPSNHMVSLFDKNKCIFHKIKGLSKTGMHTLPKQKHPVAVFFTEKDMQHHTPDRNLPETISMQYDRLKIEFKKVQYIPMRDCEIDREYCMVYAPVSIKM